MSSLLSIVSMAAEYQNGQLHWEAIVPKINISKLKLQQLNTTSLALIAKFAHSLKAYNGNVISLRDEHALRSVIREAKKSDSAELQEIYAELKGALKTHLNSKREGDLRDLDTPKDQTKLNTRR